MEEVFAMNIIEGIFERMDKWRNLPKYALERRADIFFGVYLKTVLEAKYDIKIKEEIIPEFPVRKATIYPNVQTNQSFNIDFLAFSEDNQIAFLIELKTDIGSRREKQDDYLRAVTKIGISKVIQGLVDIFRATNRKRKYFHLLKMLEDIGIIELPSQLQSKVFSKNRVELNILIGKMKIIAPINKCKVVYLQPTGNSDDVITFNEFSRLIQEFDDPITQRFVESHKTWSEIKAGHLDIEQQQLDSL